MYKLSHKGCKTVVALVDLTFTNSSPFTPTHSGFYDYYALAINPSDRFTVFNPFSLSREMPTQALLSFAKMLFLFCLCFLTPAGIKEEAGSPVDSKQEVFGIW